MPEAQEKQKPLYLNSFVQTAGVVAVFVMGLYFYHFAGNGFSGKGENWGTFGDFLGGTLNPVFGFITILLLIETLRQSREALIQNDKALEQGRIALEQNNKALEQNREEIKLSREELEKSSEALQDQAKQMDEQRKEEEKRFKATLHHKIVSEKLSEFQNALNSESELTVKTGERSFGYDTYRFIEVITVSSDAFLFSLENGLSHDIKRHYKYKVHSRLYNLARAINRANRNSTDDPIIEDLVSLIDKRIESIYRLGFFGLDDDITADFGEIRNAFTFLNT
ncbi:hypothetical protein [Endozoicomonas arenosclerae]|uniref:hypothetical protein n=1 Tax=Endozoicomonas arenosclerae TaxID=1633495 RepID=UPI000784EA37|nr:hypothetical protein [Endozoicomonas arenosclerae]